MPESMDKWSVGVGRRHPVTMCKASFRTLRRVLALQHQTSAQYSVVEQTRDRAAVRSALTSTPHPESTSRLSSVTCEDSFFSMPLDGDGM